MKLSIDVIFIDEDMKVIKKVENLKPGKMIIPVKEAWAGKFKNVNNGDKIDI